MIKMKMIIKENILYQILIKMILKQKKIRK